MNVNDLIGSAPELLQKLSELGLSAEQIDLLGNEVGRQLAPRVGSEGLIGLLAELDRDAFRAAIDPAALADRLGISARTAGGALSLVANQVARFSGDRGSLLDGSVNFARRLLDED